MPILFTSYQTLSFEVNQEGSPLTIRQLSFHSLHGSFQIYPQEPPSEPHILACQARLYPPANPREILTHFLESIPRPSVATSATARPSNLPRAARWIGNKIPEPPSCGDPQHEDVGSDPQNSFPSEQSESSVVTTAVSRVSCPRVRGASGLQENAFV